MKYAKLVLDGPWATELDILDVFVYLIEAYELLEDVEEIPVIYL